jgi:hypothetical protein
MCVFKNVFIRSKNIFEILYFCFNYLGFGSLYFGTLYFGTLYFGTLYFGSLYILQWVGSSLKIT